MIPPVSPLEQASFVPLSADAWRLLVEAEIDTIVRELRKNALWAEAVERDGVGALWVGGGRWPTAHGLHATTTNSMPETQPEDGIDTDSQRPPPSGRPALSALKMDRYRQEFASRRTLGKAGVCIGLASFADKGDDAADDEYAMGRIMMLESFLLLREAINGVSDPHTMDLQTILDPFFLVIRDPETTGPITRCTLVSIQRFISHGIVDFSHPRAAPALLELARAVTHCRFEATDAASDEAVLMQILNVLGTLVNCSGSRYLNDVTVCEIMETVLSMSCQMRLSEMLRKSAESTLFTLVTFVFGRLNEMQHEVGNGSDDSSAVEPVVVGGAGAIARDGGEALMTMPSASSMLVNTDRSRPASMMSARDGARAPATDTPTSAEEPIAESNPADLHVDHAPLVAELGAGSVAEEPSGDAGNVPSFGLPAIRELYRVLVALTNPRDLQYTDSMRLLALNTLQAAFQTAGAAMSVFAALRELTLGDLSHSLLLILQRDQPNLISPTLRVLFLVFASHRRDTKGHLELFLCQTLGRIMTPPVVEKQGSRTPLRQPAGHGSRPQTPKIGVKRAPPKARSVSEARDGVRPSADPGLGITDLHERSSLLSNVSQGTQPGSRRPSMLAAYSHAVPDIAQPMPAMSALLEDDYPLTHAQEVELYHEASLRRGVRGRIASLETRRQLLEGLHHLLIGDESLITDLWVNYDCDMQRGNMFDFLISFITQRAVPWPETPDDAEDEAFLDILMYYLIRMALRAGVAPPQGNWALLLGMPSSLPSTEPASESKLSSRPVSLVSGAATMSAAKASVPLSIVQLEDRKKHKETMMHAAKLFNEKPKDGIAYLQRVGALASDSGSEMTMQLAQFLRETPTINKKLLGEFIAKPSNLEVLQAYIQQFDFSGRRLDEALRSLLGTFRLPGESQQIERIVEAFSATYFASGPADIANKDAAFILSYAIIMLNTDQHSPQVKSRMKIEHFARNLRNVNDGQDFRSGFLADVYNAIRDREIVFPEEHEGEAGFEFAWREVLAGDSLVGPWASTRGITAEYDRCLLAETWPRLLLALARILTHFNSDQTLRLALSGLHALVASAAHYGLSTCVNEAMCLLAGMTGLTNSALHADLSSPQVLCKSYNRYLLLDPESPTSALGIVAEGFTGAEQLAKLQEQEEASVQLTQAALEFGKDYRGQIAFVALVQLSLQFPGEIGRQAWMDILDVVGVAANADLLPRASLAAQDLLVDNMWVPRISTLQAMDAAQQRIRVRLSRGLGGGQAAQQGGGLLSAISSFWGGSSAGSGTGGTGGGSSSLQSSGGRKQELRWRASPDTLVLLATRSKMAVQASGIEMLGSLADRLGSSLPVFLSALSLLFPQPQPSQPNTPDDSTARQGDDVKAGAKSTSPRADTRANGGAGSSNYSPASLFFLELAISLVMRSPERAPAIWPSIERSLQRMLEYADVLHRFSLERAVSGLLGMAVRILECYSEQESAMAETTAPLMEVIERILRCLGLLRDARDPTFDAVATQLAAGIERLVDTDAKTLLAVPTNWDIIRLLLKRLAHTQDPALVQPDGDTARRSLAVLVEIVILLKCGAIEPAIYFTDVLDTLSAFMPSDRALSAPASPVSAKDNSDRTAGRMSAVEAASKLIVLLHDLQDIAKSRLVDSDVAGSPPALTTSPVTTGRQLLPRGHTEPSVTSMVSAPLSILRLTKSSPLPMWISVMNALTAYVCTGNREVRQLACSYIQRALSANLQNVSWVTGAFHRVLFPLMDMLLRADLLADSAMEDTHARCISMLTMFFLHNASALQGTDGPSANQAIYPQLRSAQIKESEGSSKALADLAGAHTGVVAEAPTEGKGEIQPPLNQIWLRLIGILSVYMHTSQLASESRAALSPQGERRMSDVSSGADAAERRHGHLGVLGEMAEESTKNCMLILESMDIFGNVTSDQEASPLWQQSWERLDKVNPQLRGRIFPPTQPLDMASLSSLSPNAAAATAAPQDTATEKAETVAMPRESGVDNAQTDAVADKHIPTTSHADAVQKPAQQQPPPEPAKKKHSKQSIIIVT
ncbi:GDP/GTP exchange factor for ARF [Coemansia linderi]|uniref:GDP/GTP exchange factor for ARF n=1 Tax=Coemansia linderi TaxID=2663919 RepID=A0ACC1KMM5_9FUNG|nr:GDP/GTP exchange factor for ARF [Coemansia linderi]